MYVTLGILLLQTMFRLLLSTRSLLFLSGYPTTLEPLPGAVTKVRVAVPAALRWHPGDHAFIRMPALSVLDNHPFTIASVPSSSSSATTATNTLTFLIRTHAGFTSRLAALAAAKSANSPSSSSPASLYRSSLSSLEEAATALPHNHNHQNQPPQAPPLRTLIDGPHSRGARVPALHATVDTVVLVAAGTGITAAVPWLLDLAQRMARDAEAGANACRVGAVRLVWVVRRAECVEWIREEVGEVLAMVEEAAAGRGGGGRRVVVDVYVTGGSGSSSEAEVGEKRREGGEGGVLVAGSGEQGGRGDVMPAAPPPAYGVAGRGEEEGRISTETEGLGTVEVEEQGGLVVHHERPVIANLLPSLMSGTRAFVMGCGPEGFKTELSNAVAKMQTEMVLKSRSMESIVLHTETFGW